jgi:predicted ATPase
VFQLGPAHLLLAHLALGHTLLLLGELASARPHVEQSSALCEHPQHPLDAIIYGTALGVLAQPRVAHALWLRGYPDQALTRNHKALALARELSHPFSLALALDYAAMLHQFQRERHAVHGLAEAARMLCQDQDFAYYAAWATILQGWVLGEQGQGAEAITQMRQGLAALRATGGELRAPYYLTLLAEAHGNEGRAAEGLRVLAEAHALVEEHEERWWEAEVHRLRGVLLLRQTVAQPDEAETWLRRALDVARRQEAKSLELRAAMSLARLWQQQGKHAIARELLAPIYGWFTEGFDTADIQEAKALLEALA